MPVENRSERPSSFSPARLLRRHVLRRAEHVAHARTLLLARGLDMGDAEVGDLDRLRAAQAHHVARLDVAVHDAACMRVVERPCELDAHDHHVAHRHRLAVGHHIGERLTVEQLHGHVGPAFDLADVVHDDDVRMRQPASSPCLLQEALAILLVFAERGMQELDRHVAPDARVVRPVHRGHAAAADALDDLVAADLADRGPGRRAPGQGFGDDPGAAAARGGSAWKRRA